MAKRATAWEKMQAASGGKTGQYRDIYEGQQLTRQDLEQESKPFTPYAVGIACVGIGVMVLVWVVVAMIQTGAAFTTGPDAWRFDRPESVGAVFGMYISHPTWLKVFWTLMFGAAGSGIVGYPLYRRWQVENQPSELLKQLNTYTNDQHIALPEEMQVKFDWFPDVGATSDVQFSSMISHIPLSNRGLKKIYVSKRSREDVLDEDGEIVTYKGEELRDDDGNVIQELAPLIDTRFMEDLYQASGIPKGRQIRTYYDATQIPYNPDGSNREKLGKFDTVADLINADWEFPWYEPQRPAGAYLVDTAPVNTMVIFSTACTVKCAGTLGLLL